jgi:GR25 family glycosyltransferase involved in LPS biosynthesis
MTLLDNVFFINLERRTDRLVHVIGELTKLGINGERVNAVEMRDGAIGCTMSHIKCLQMAKTRNLPHVFICEDDITFLNPSLLLENITKFETSGLDWEVLIIGGNNVPPYTQISDFCIRVTNNQTTTGYIVKQDYYDTLIANFKESASKLIREPANRRNYAIDMYWKSLQSSGKWYMIIPPTVVQYEDYSDIEKRNVDYRGLLLDLDKPWLFQRLAPMSLSSIGQMHK